MRQLFLSFNFVCTKIILHEYFFFYENLLDEIKVIYLHMRRRERNGGLGYSWLCIVHIITLHHDNSQGIATLLVNLY